MAMVKKHHAWKVTGPDVFLYGEDIYGTHSIVYEPVREDRTFYAFALRDRAGGFASFDDLRAYADSLEMATVPVLFEGRFGSLGEMQAFMEAEQAKPSALGGEREGLVLRMAGAFPAADFPLNVCKSVRQDHVQSDEHWRRNWKPCRILGIGR